MNRDEFMELLKMTLDEVVDNYSEMGTPEDFADSDGFIDDVEDEEFDDSDFDDELDIFYDDSSSDSDTYESEYRAEPKPARPKPTTTDSEIPNVDISDTEEDVVNDLFEDVFNSFMSRVSPSEEERKRVMGTEQPFERMATGLNECKFFGNTFKYTRYEEPLKLPDTSYLAETESLDDKLVSFGKVVNLVMSELSSIYGGQKRITDVAIVSGALIINSVSFEPLVDSEFISCLPFDLQYAVKSGCFAGLIDYGYFLGCKNLINFLVDDADFLFSKIRVDMGFRTDFEPKFMFKKLSGLRNLQVGENVITRSNLDACDELYARRRKTEELIKKLDDLGVKGFKASWGSVWSIIRSDEKSAIVKGVKVLGMTGVAGVATGGAVVTKLGRFAHFTGKSMLNGIKDIGTALKEF